MTALGSFVRKIPVWLKTMGAGIGIALAFGNASGHVTTTEYDRDGYQIALTDPLGLRSTTRVDVLGRPLEVQLPDGSTRRWAWDRAGQPVAHIDGRGGRGEWKTFTPGKSGGN